MGYRRNNVKDKNETDTEKKKALVEKWQKLKMLIGVISEGEAAQGREGSRAAGRQADRQGCVRKACVCVTRWEGGKGREGEWEPR